LCTADGHIKQSQEIWQGSIKWGKTMIQAQFEVFPSGGSWKMLLKQLQVVHNYKFDVI
ncbi:hypothetical protein PAXRUDRAFT_42342, partial [Paxillus rubicundulus Ve08.2h10]